MKKKFVVMQIRKLSMKSLNVFRVTNLDFNVHQSTFFFAKLQQRTGSMLTFHQRLYMLMDPEL